MKAFTLITISMTMFIITQCFRDYDEFPNNKEETFCSKHTKLDQVCCEESATLFNGYYMRTENFSIMYQRCLLRKAIEQGGKVTIGDKDAF